jgi:hypothetical protein
MLPLAQYLRELSPDTARKKSAKGLSDFDLGATELERRIEEARMLGVLEGRAAVQAEFDARMKSQVSELEKKFAQERARWARDEGERLGTRLLASIEGLKAYISNTVASVLRPVLAEEVRRRAVGELTTTLDKMLSGGELGKITISGPRDLIEPMRAHLGGKASNVTYVTAEGCDLAVQANETVLETRIGAWVAAIQGGQA